MSPRSGLRSSAPAAWGARFARPAFWTACFVALGITARSLAYARNPSVWIDEAALLVNVVEKDFIALLGRLTFFEAAPPLFLWVEKILVFVAGDSTYAMRFPAFLASIVGLLVMVLLARRSLPREAVPIALLLVACSDRLIWHASEAKPYAVDVLCSVVIATIFVTTRSWRPERAIALFGVLAPIVIWLSYPGTFLYGGVLLALFPTVLRHQEGKVRAAYLFFFLSVAVSFGLLYSGPILAQRGEPMDSMWADAFPQYSRPWTVPWWLIRQSFSIADYCFRPTGGLLLLPALLGARSMWRRGRRDLVVLLAAPGGCALAAAALQQYPYSGSRVMVFLLPALAIFFAEAVWAAWTGTRETLRTAAAILMAAILMGPAALTVAKAARPAARTDTAGASAFVLSSLEPADVVASPEWAYRYYCRGIGDRFILLDQHTSLPASARLWLIIHSGGAEEVPPARADVGPAWVEVTRREFAGAAVFLLERR